MANQHRPALDIVDAIEQLKAAFLNAGLRRPLAIVVDGIIQRQQLERIVLEEMQAILQVESIKPTPVGMVLAGLEIRYVR